MVNWSPEARGGVEGHSRIANTVDGTDGLRGQGCETTDTLEHRLSDKVRPTSLGIKS
jgi:hypothetical protein